MQLGETGPLDERELAARVLANGRGGYCFELNTLLAALLRACGFSVTHHQAVVGGEGPTNHMVLLVQLDDAVWIADAGLGEGFMEPLPLREGRFERGPLHYTLSREPEGTWWMGQHEWSSFSGFRMQPSESVVADFEPHHRRLALEPGSPFVRTLVVQSPRDDRIVTLALADAVRDRAVGGHEARAVSGRVRAGACRRVRDLGGRLAARAACGRSPWSNTRPSWPASANTGH